MHPHFTQKSVLLNINAKQVQHKLSEERGRVARSGQRIHLFWLTSVGITTQKHKLDVLSTDYRKLPQASVGLVQPRMDRRGSRALTASGGAPGGLGAWSTAHTREKVPNHMGRIRSRTCASQCIVSFVAALYSYTPSINSLKDSNDICKERSNDNKRIACSKTIPFFFAREADKEVFATFCVWGETMAKMTRSQGGMTRSTACRYPGVITDVAHYVSPREIRNAKAKSAFHVLAIWMWHFIHIRLFTPSQLVKLRVLKIALHSAQYK